MANSTTVYGSISITKVEDGKQYYTWMKFADDARGSNMGDDSAGKSYMGIAYNKTTETESNNPSDYVWTLIKGADGLGVKKINTYVRNFSINDWRKYGTIEHEENWLTGDDYDNTHIRVGDTAYVVGTVDQSVGVGGYPVEAMIYGVVLENTNAHVRMSSTCLIIGGQNGEKGDDGTPGASVTLIETQYQIGEDSTNAPTSDSWTTDLGSLKWEPGKYIWRREKVSYSSGSPTYTTPVVDESFAIVGQWCAEADKTKIDGGKIYTGSVTADKIQANSITAAQLATDAITSNNYKKGVSGSKLNLADGTFDSPYFKFDELGKIDAREGIIGPWVLNDQGLFNAKNLKDSTIGLSTEGASNVAFWAGGRFVQAPFRVTYDGKLYATGAEIEGKITSTEGVIAGWTIAQKDPDGNTYTGGIYHDISHDGNTYRVGMKVEECELTDASFYVTKNPLATNADGSFAGENIFYVQHDGKLVATAGTIGGWTIAPKTGSTTYTGGIYSDVEGYRVGIKTEGCAASDYAFYVAQNPLDSVNRKVLFGVQHDGKLYAKNAEIEGKITATAGSFDRSITIGGKSLSSWLSSSGNVYKINATTGSIGGWNIDSNSRLYTDGGSYIHSNGTFTFTPNGNANGVVMLSTGASGASPRFTLGNDVEFYVGDRGFDYDDFVKLRQFLNTL